MIVQSTLASYSAAGTARSPSLRQNSFILPANTAGTARVFQSTQDDPASLPSVTAANRNKSFEMQLAEISASSVLNRSRKDHDSQPANDQKLAAITAQGKSPDKLTAEELDYMQKATGFINTFAHLSPAEKALYDKAVASGNTEAAEGIAQIALIRTGGHIAGGANGATYNPVNMEITAGNVAKYFSHSIVDPTAGAQAKFQALIQFLQDNSAAA